MKAVCYIFIAGFFVASAYAENRDNHIGSPPSTVRSTSTNPANESCNEAFDSSFLKAKAALENVLHESRFKKADFSDPDKFRELSASVSLLIRAANINDSDAKRNSFKNYLAGSLIKIKQEANRRQLAKIFQQQKINGEPNPLLLALEQAGVKIPGPSGDIDLSGMDFNASRNPEQLSTLVSALQNLYPDVADQIPNLFYNGEAKRPYYQHQTAAVMLGNQYVWPPVDCYGMVNEQRRGEPNQRILSADGYHEILHAIRKDIGLNFDIVAIDNSENSGAMTQFGDAFADGAANHPGTLLSVFDSGPASNRAIRRRDQRETQQADESTLKTDVCQLRPAGMPAPVVSETRRLVAELERQNNEKMLQGNAQAQAFLRTLMIAGSAPVLGTPAVVGALSAAVLSTATSAAKAAVRTAMGDGSLACNFVQEFSGDASQLERAVLTGAALGPIFRGLSGTKQFASAMKALPGATAIPNLGNALVTAKNGYERLEIAGELRDRASKMPPGTERTALEKEAQEIERGIATSLTEAAIDVASLAPGLIGRQRPKYDQEKLFAEAKQVLGLDRDLTASEKAALMRAHEVGWDGKGKFTAGELKEKIESLKYGENRDPNSPQVFDRKQRELLIRSGVAGEAQRVAAGMSANELNSARRIFRGQEGKSVILVDRESGKFRAGEFLRIDTSGEPKILMKVDGEVRAYYLARFDLEKSVTEGSRFAFTSARGTPYYGKFVRQRSNGSFKFIPDGTSEPIDINAAAVATIHNPDKRMPVNIIPDPTIVAENAVMRSRFMSHGNIESIGGNAGTGNMAVNMAVDPSTGKILVIGNFQDYPLAIREQLKSGQVREVAILKDLKGNAHLGLGVDLNPKARANLEESLRAFGLSIAE